MMMIIMMIGYEQDNDGDDDDKVDGDHGDNEDEVQRLASSQQVGAVS